MNKQMRVSDSLYREISELEKKYDTNKAVLLNTMIVVLKILLENKTTSFEIIDENGEKKQIVIPLIFKK